MYAIFTKSAPFPSNLLLTYFIVQNFSLLASSISRSPLSSLDALRYFTLPFFSVLEFENYSMGKDIELC